MNTPTLTSAQRAMLLRGEHHRIDVARTPTDCAAWSRTRRALVAKGLVPDRFPQHPAGGVSLRLILTPEGHALREQLLRAED